LLKRESSIKAAAGKASIIKVGKASAKPTSARENFTGESSARENSVLQVIVEPSIAGKPFIEEQQAYNNKISIGTPPDMSFN
jgi:hypothetical protein